MNLVRQGYLDATITEILEEFDLAQPFVKKWSEQTQAHYDEVGAMLLKGTQSSDKTYCLQRAIVMLAKETPPKLPVKKRTLPKALKGNIPELRERLQCAVEKAGGPWNVTWGDKFWIEREVISPLREGEPSADLVRAVNWIHDRAQSLMQQNIGSTLKLLYLSPFFEQCKSDERLSMLQQHEEDIGNWKDIDRNEREWQTLVDKYPALWSSVPHSSFVACSLYRNFIHSRPRRSYTKEGQVIIPGLTSLAKVNKEIREHAIGIWKMSKDTQVSDPPEGALSCEAILQGNFPIGHPFLTPLSGRFSQSNAEEGDKDPPLQETQLPEARNPTLSRPEYVAPSRGYVGRWVPLKQVLIYLLTIALKHDLLILPKDTSVPLEIQFGSWMDGKTSLAHSLVVTLIFLVWDSSYTKAGRLRWIDVVRFYPLSLTVLPENIVSVEYLVSQLRKEVVELRPMQWAGRTVKFIYRLVIGDNSIQQKFVGNSVGGNFRCQSCDIDFSLRAVWSWKYMASRFVKTLASMLQRCLVGDADTVGLPRLCRLLGDRLEDLSTLDLSSEPLQFILHFVVGLDPLHTCTGHTPDIINQMAAWHGWDEAVFLSTISSVVQRRLVSEMNGAKLRLLVASYEDTILPALHAIPEELQQKVRDFLHNYREVPFFFFFVCVLNSIS